MCIRTEEHRIKNSILVEKNPHSLSWSEREYVVWAYHFDLKFQPLWNSMMKALPIFLSIFIGISLAQRRNYSGAICPSGCICYRQSIRCMKLDLETVPRISTQTSLLWVNNCFWSEWIRKEFIKTNLWWIKIFSYVIFQKWDTWKTPILSVQINYCYYFQYKN